MLTSDIVSSELHVDSTGNLLASIHQSKKRIVFVHDGAKATVAEFDTIVSDAKGATSGKVQHVNVSVRD